MCPKHWMTAVVVTESVIAGVIGNRNVNTRLAVTFIVLPATVAEDAQLEEHTTLTLSPESPPSSCRAAQVMLAGLEHCVLDQQVGCSAPYAAPSRAAFSTPTYV